MSDFDYSDFVGLTADIERYLGYLKGNETVAEYFLQQQGYVEAHMDEWGVDAAYSGWVDYRTTPSEGDLVVDFTMWHWVIYIHEPFDERRGPWADQLIAGAGESFDNGCAWADGIGGYFRDLLADITRPDADLLKSAFQEFSDTRAALEAALPVDWTDLDFTSWVGLSSDACQDVVTEFHSTVRDQYLTYFAHAETLFGGAGAVVAQAQNGLVPMLESVRDGLREQLVMWARDGRQPSDYAGINPLVPDIAGIVSDVADLVPGLGEIKGKVEGVGGIAHDILGLFGVDVGLHPREAFDAKTAEEVYTELTNTLEDDYLRPLDQGMQRLRSEKSQAIVSEQRGLDPWYIDTLDGIANEPWQHEAEAS